MRTVEVGGDAGKDGGALVRMTGKDTYEISQSRFTTCEPGRDDWYVRAREMDLDYASNLGVARGAWVEFKGVPLLYTPWIDFPLQERRKSGLLAPTFKLGGGNGIEFAQPYYLNLAPNYDATVIPRVLSRRGLMLGGEFRYLEPRHNGRLRLHLLPGDHVTNSTRYAWEVDNEGWLGRSTQYRAKLLRVSDDSYWKDFPQIVPSVMPRLLQQDLQLQREQATLLGPLTAYARVQHWQVLQTGTGNDRIVAPYERSPQLGLRLLPLLPAGLDASLETEVNHFTRTAGTADPTAPTGWRWHALGRISRPFTWPGAWVTPPSSQPRQP